LELSIAETAVRLGVSVDTIRRRIRRGELSARQDGRGHYVVVLEDGEAGTAPPLSSGTVEGELGRVRLELAHAEELLIEVRRQRDQLEAQVTAQHDQLSAAEEERHELRILLGSAMQPSTPALAAPTQDTVTLGKERRRRWLWR